MPAGSIARRTGKSPVSGKSTSGTTGSLARPPVMHNTKAAEVVIIQLRGGYGSHERWKVGYCSERDMRNRKAALDNVCRITQRQISTRGRPVRHRERRLQFTAVSPAVRINYLPADASSSICVNACSKRRRAHPVERVCQLLTVSINQWRSLLSQSGPSVATSMDESWFPFNSAELTSQPPPRLSPTSLTSEKLRHTITSLYTFPRAPPARPLESDSAVSRRKLGIGHKSLDPA